MPGGPGPGPRPRRPGPQGQSESRVTVERPGRRRRHAGGRRRGGPGGPLAAQSRTWLLAPAQPGPSPGPDRAPDSVSQNAGRPGVKVTVTRAVSNGPARRTLPAEAAAGLTDSEPGSLRLTAGHWHSGWAVLAGQS